MLHHEAHEESTPPASRRNSVGNVEGGSCSVLVFGLVVFSTTTNSESESSRFLGMLTKRCSLRRLLKGLNESL